jgi:hypothetical protein
VAKKKISFAKQLGHAVSDVANAVSVAATGSEIGVLEAAAEDELNPRPARRPRKKKVVRKKKAARKRAALRKATRRKAGKQIKKKRSARRR